MGRSCEGRVALVTGASRGIGKAIATRLGAEGADVAIVARTAKSGDHRLPGSVDESVDLIQSFGVRAKGFTADLGDPAVDVDALVDEVEHELGLVDILVNNVAGGGYQFFMEWTDAQIERVLQLNFWVPWRLVRRTLPGMRARGRGAVLNISSASAIHPQGPPFATNVTAAKGTIYGGSKAMLDRWTISLGAELHAEGAGIAVNALSPQAAAATESLVTNAWFPEHLFEPLDTMAEAALALCTGDPAVLTGQITYSLALLQQLGRPVYDLHGISLLEGWQPSDLGAKIDAMTAHRRGETAD